MGYGKHNRSKGGNSSRGRTDNLAREDESLPLDQEPEDEAPVPKVQLAMILVNVMQRGAQVVSLLDLTC